MNFANFGAASSIVSQLKSFAKYATGILQTESNTSNTMTTSICLMNVDMGDKPTFDQKRSRGSGASSVRKDVAEG